MKVIQAVLIAILVMALIFLAKENDLSTKVLRSEKQELQEKNRQLKAYIHELDIRIISLKAKDDTLRLKISQMYQRIKENKIKDERIIVDTANVNELVNFFAGIKAGNNRQ